MGWASLALLLGIFWFSSCYPGLRPEGFIGKYQLRSGRTTMGLDVRANGTYVERVEYSDGSDSTNVQKWFWGSGSLCLVDFVVPRDVIPAELLGLYGKRSGSRGREIGRAHV